MSGLRDTCCIYWLYICICICIYIYSKSKQGREEKTVAPYKKCTPFHIIGAVYNALSSVIEHLCLDINYCIQDLHCQCQCNYKNNLVTFKHKSHSVQSLKESSKKTSIHLQPEKQRHIIFLWHDQITHSDSLGVEKNNCFKCI